MPLPVIGLLGSGQIAREHAASFQPRGLLDALLVFDPDASRASAFVEELGGLACATEAELIAKADLIWICSPPVFHRAAIEAACAAGKAIFCEKPLAISEADLAAIERAVAEAGVPFYMGHSGRWSHPFQRLRQLVADGAIGDPVTIWSRRVGWLAADAAPAWRLDDAVSGGVLIELGVHEIDFLRWVGGEWRQAAGWGSSRSLAPGRFLDTVTAGGRLTNGAHAQLYLSWAEPRYLWQRGAQGTEGSLHFDDSTFTELQLWRPGKREPERLPCDDWRHPDTGENMAFHEQLAALLAAWNDERPFPVTLADGAAAVRAALAIRHALDTDTAVEVTT